MVGARSDEEMSTYVHLHHMHMASQHALTTWRQEQHNNTTTDRSYRRVLVREHYSEVGFDVYDRAGQIHPPGRVQPIPSLVRARVGRDTGGSLTTGRKGEEGWFGASKRQRGIPASMAVALHFALPALLDLSDTGGPTSPEQPRRGQSTSEEDVVEE